MAVAVPLVVAVEEVLLVEAVEASAAAVLLTVFVDEVCCSSIMSLATKLFWRLTRDIRWWPRRLW